MTLAVQLESFVFNVLFVSLLWLMLALLFFGIILQFFVVSDGNIIGKAFAGDSLEGPEYKRIHPLFRKAYRAIVVVFGVIVAVTILALAALAII